MDELVETIAAGIRVLVTRDGVELSEMQIRERARNIAQAVYGLTFENEDAAA